MDREDWYAMIRKEDISVRFAKEIESYFSEYPGPGIIEALWNSDWGREVAEHFGIEHLRVPAPLRALLKQFHVSTVVNSDSDTD